MSISERNKQIKLYKIKRSTILYTSTHNLNTKIIYIFSVRNWNGPTKIEHPN